MSRPKKNRIVSTPPRFQEFMPASSLVDNIPDVSLGLDEFEAIRLADYLGMDHEDAAAEMDISRSTFTRLVEQARSKVAHLLVDGHRLKIGGGAVHFRENMVQCRDCGQVFDSGFPSSITQCPDCGSHRLIDLAEGFGHGKCCRGQGGRGGQRRHGRR